MWEILKVLKIRVHGIAVNICHFSQLEKRTQLSSVVSIGAGKVKKKREVSLRTTFKA